MRRTGSIFLRLMVTVILITAIGLPMTVSAKDQPDQSGAAFEKLLKKARKDDAVRSSLRIVADGLLADGLNRLTIHGRGIGIWNGQSQFSTSKKLTVAAIDSMLKAEFSGMPDRFAYDVEEDDRPKPIKVIRMVTVAVGDLEKTVVQDDRGPLSEAFATMTSELVALCREAAASGVTAATLEDGLRKVANGTLAPETLWISANAPQLKSLESQEGQGWLLDIRHGRLNATSRVLGESMRTVSDRPLGDGESKILAKKLLGAGAPDLSLRINTKGYTQLSIAVLDKKVRTMARTFAATPDEEEKAAEKTFAAVREVLYDFFHQDVTHSPEN